MIFKVDEGMHIASSVWGDERNPLVVLLPGGGADKECMEPDWRAAWESRILDDSS